MPLWIGHLCLQFHFRLLPAAIIFSFYAEHYPIDYLTHQRSLWFNSFLVMRFTTLCRWTSVNIPDDNGKISWFDSPHVQTFILRIHIAVVALELFLALWIWGKIPIQILLNEWGILLQNWYKALHDLHVSPPLKCLWQGGTEGFLPQPPPS